MDRVKLIDLLSEIQTLKRLPRSGWLMRGVPHVESVADHSLGVGLVALVLADGLAASGELDAPLDGEKVLALALLHDLAEVRLTDLPLSASSLLSAPVKRRAEEIALAELLEPLPGAGRLVALWAEFEDQSTPEGRLVRDADKLEMMVQCLRYEESGIRGLDEFWQVMDGHAWHFALCAELYAGLSARRPGRGNGPHQSNHR